jgi:uncharacterized protein (TIGR00730 family)
MNSICVFCGAAEGHSPAYATLAAGLGQTIAERGLRLVYGGGKAGLMGIVANNVLQAGGEVLGIMPESLVNKERAHTGLTELQIVPDMRERKARMEALSDGFIALPGGFGTLEEIIEIISWAQIGLHHKPFGLLNVQDYYTPLLNWFEDMVTAGFATATGKGLLYIAQEPSELLDQFATHQGRTYDRFLGFS